MYSAENRLAWIRGPLDSKAAVFALAMLVLGFSAVAAADASAAKFQTNEFGTLAGSATSTQTFKTNGGSIECTAAATSGSVEYFEAASQKVTVAYSSCKAFGIANVSISPAEFELHAGGTVDVLNTITLSVAATIFFPKCTITVGPQSGLGSISYKNSSGKVTAEFAISGITYSSSGGACGASGSNGTYTGNDELALNEGTGVLAVLAGGTLSKKVFLNGVERNPPVCNFANIGDICKIEFKVTGAGAGEGWKVERTEWKGAMPEVRYKKTVNCTAGTVLGNNQTCKDEIEMIKKEAGNENQWCVVWEGGGLNNIPFCTRLFM